MTAPLTLVACSHGTRAPAARTLVTALVDRLTDRLPGVPVVEMFVDVQEPALATSLPGVHGEVVVVPLFLSGGYHLNYDISPAAAGHPHATVTAPLGPHPLLTDLQVQRLREVGLGPDDSLVMAASASSDQRAVADVRRAADLLQTRLDTDVCVGVVGGRGVQVRDAVDAARRRGRRVMVSSYLLMPGYFHSQVLAAGAEVVSAPLLDGPPPEQLVELVTLRFAQRRTDQAA